jgi:putative transposase
MVGLPKAISLDNGSELRSAVFMVWCEEKGIELKFIQPGKPQQNAFIERFNRTYRHEYSMPISLNRSSRFEK